MDKRLRAASELTAIELIVNMNGVGSNLVSRGSVVLSLLITMDR